MPRKSILRMVRLCLIVCSLSFFGGCFKKRPIHYAAYNGDLEKVKEIIEMDPNEINVKDRLDFTPLHLASGKGHSEIVEFLLNHGADIESEMFDRETPLLVAARFAGHDGKYETIKTLLEHGAKVNHKDKHGRTALHYAAMYSGKEVMNLLISYGADVNAKEEYQITPLHQAAMLNNIEAAKALVEHGADIFAKTYCDETNMTEDEKSGFPMMRHIMNKTAKEIALKRNEKELAQYLQTEEEEEKKKEKEKGKKEKGDK
jgi:ankyrin repeat protein